MSSLAHGMSKLEGELHKEQQEKVSALSDLASVRELCVKLDSGKELTARQLTAKSMELEKVRTGVVVGLLVYIFSPGLVGWFPLNTSAEVSYLAMLLLCRS